MLQNQLDYNVKTVKINPFNNSKHLTFSSMFNYTDHGTT